MLFKWCVGGKLRILLIASQYRKSWNSWHCISVPFQELMSDTREGLKGDLGKYWEDFVSHLLFLLSLVTVGCVPLLGCFLTIKGLT